ncbi:LysR family transcriptional regulator [Actinobacillus succinogenes]|uniref:Transcriptional regulator, LysR family n=1 Tax=Actinobacillus succinogenes (strain ATCC 55618 / DSM 22257 / CCUG 43843 / 130Z) TaxID=339671 RepID=A6VNG7_ACTSZ|nr:LysR family transcriptional regulator [Actinobacillus succinogenes]ABR74514.1 transcriptional regulator, LysR family [Actinobacillus succinogenes 130Z]PHI41068.1 LysR family transcriptional regulator [Actinobacillus succinogenes]
MEKVSLDDMRLFVSVVQAGSLHLASELTGVPISRLSRRMTQLERALGSKLMDRGKKGVTLNDLGLPFFQRAQHMLQLAEQAVSGVQDSLTKPNGLLRISVAGDIMRMLIAPYLPAYLAENPDVNIDIHQSPQKINMIQDGIDIAIRVGSIENENVVARKFLDIRFGVYSAPEYLEGHEPLHSPQDIYRHAGVVHALSLPWRFIQGHQRLDIMPAGKLTVNDYLLAAHFIRQGAGIGMLPTFVGDQTPELIKLLPDWEMPTVPLSVIYYKNRGTVPTIRSFTQYLLGLNQA